MFERGSFKLLFFTLLTLHYAISSPIKNVVVLMLENRSFDHMVGFLKQTLNPEIDGLNGDETNPAMPFVHDSPLIQVDTSAPYVTINPGHSIHDSTQQIFGGPEGYDIYPPLMNGFVANANHYQPGIGNTVMQCFNSSTVPTLSTLASEFAIFDRWYSSVPGPTEVNRLYVNSATSHGMTTNDLEWEVEGLPQKTIFDSLNEIGLSWNVYYEEISSVLFFKNVRSPQFYPNFREFDDFQNDVMNGELANYTFIEPRYYDLFDLYASDQHPSHNVARGEMLVQQVYQILRNGPQWNSTLLIITYDEHGGFFDHVPPPMKGVPNPDGINGTFPQPIFDFTRLGVRVPTIMVSPWINKGIIIHEPNHNKTNSHYEHSSIPATLKKIFNFTDFLTKRDAWASTFEHIFEDRSSPRTDCPIDIPAPQISEDGHEYVDGDGQLNDLQIGFMQFAGAINQDYSWKNIDTEFEGSIYTRKYFRKFLQKD